MHFLTIRVVLHNATLQHYLDLAARLAAIGITDLIRSDDGVLYRLPGGEYNYEGPLDAWQIELAVSDVASSVVPAFAVVVADSRLRVWRGLPIVSEAPNALFHLRSA